MGFHYKYRFILDKRRVTQTSGCCDTTAAEEMHTIGKEIIQLALMSVLHGLDDQLISLLTEMIAKSSLDKVIRITMVFI